MQNSIRGQTSPKITCICKRTWAPALQFTPKILNNSVIDPKNHLQLKKIKTEKQTYLWRERERDSQQDKVIQRVQSEEDTSRRWDESSEILPGVQKHQSRAEMKELIWCGNEPDRGVQLHLCPLSATCPNVTHTHMKRSVSVTDTDKLLLYRQLNRHSNN